MHAQFLRHAWSDSQSKALTGNRIRAFLGTWYLPKYLVLVLSTQYAFALMKSYHAEIIGMTCDACVRAVKNRLARTAGVTLKDVQVGSANFSLDESRATIADIEDAISDEGYTVDSVESR